MGATPAVRAGQCGTIRNILTRGNEVQMGAKVPRDAMPNVAGLIQDYFRRYQLASPSDLHPFIVESHQRRLLGAAIPTPEGQARAEYIASLVPMAVSYQGVVKWFYIMRQLGIIEFSHSVPAHGLPKNFWRIVEGRLLDIQPGLPYKLYPSNVWGKGRYRRLKREGLLETGREATPVGKWARET